MVMGSAVGTEPWIFLILRKQGVVSCQSDTGYWHKCHASLFSRVTWEILVPEWSNILLFFSYLFLKWLNLKFVSSKANRFSYVLLLEVLMSGSYWKSQQEPLLSSWLIFPCLYTVVLLRCVLDSDLAFSNVLKVETKFDYFSVLW